jgi:hypothetical protein
MPAPPVGAWGTGAQEAEVEATSVAREAVARLESQLRRASTGPATEDDPPAPPMPPVAEELGAGPPPSIWPRPHRPPLLDGDATTGDEVDDEHEQEHELDDEVEDADPPAAEAQAAEAQADEAQADGDGDQIWPTGWWGQDEDR